MSARLRLVEPEDRFADAERHVARRRDRTELTGILDLLVAGGFVLLIAINVLALVAGWCWIVAQTFGG